jgi:hypothetical protein
VTSCSRAKGRSKGLNLPLLARLHVDVGCRWSKSVLCMVSFGGVLLLRWRFFLSFLTCFIETMDDLLGDSCAQTLSRSCTTTVSSFYVTLYQIRPDLVTVPARCSTPPVFFQNRPLYQDTSVDNIWGVTVFGTVPFTVQECSKCRKGVAIACSLICDLVMRLLLGGTVLDDFFFFL